MIELTLSPRGLTQATNSPIKKYFVDNGVKRQKPINNSIPFLAEKLREEVLNGPKSQVNQKIKQLKNLNKGFVLILGAPIVMSLLTSKNQTVYASTDEPSMLVGEEGTEITPDIVMDWGVQLSLITVAIGVAISGSLLAMAGVYRMFRKRKEAEEWTTDIIKGLVQVLIAVPTVYALFHLAQIVFKSLPVLSNL